tara:strand:+ start:7626 stop:7868 length:243 start_codon:yes stop_codon:yes gene_type:complete
MIGRLNELLLCALEIIFIKFLWPLFVLAKHNNSYEISSSSKINLIEDPDIGLMPADSHLLKNFTSPNIFDLSVSATDGTE